MSEVQVRGWGGLCLDLAGGRTEAGTNVQVWSCGALGGANTAGQGLPANGLDVQLFDCRQEQMNQRWSITGRIRMAASTLCLTREGGADRDGIAVRVATCSGSPAQTWDYYPG